MIASRVEILIETLFHKQGHVFGKGLSKEEAYGQLKELSGEDFGLDESKWRKWLEGIKTEIDREIEDRVVRDLEEQANRTENQLNR